MYVGGWVKVIIFSCQLKFIGMQYLVFFGGFFWDLSIISLYDIDCNHKHHHRAEKRMHA
jgi:hypothetical protein